MGAPANPKPRETSDRKIQRIKAKYATHGIVLKALGKDS